MRWHLGNKSLAPFLWQKRFGVNWTTIKHYSMSKKVPQVSICYSSAVSAYCFLSVRHLFSWGNQNASTPRWIICSFTNFVTWPPFTTFALLLHLYDWAECKGWWLMVASHFPPLCFKNSTFPPKDLSWRRQKHSCHWDVAKPTKSLHSWYVVIALTCKWHSVFVSQACWSSTLLGETRRTWAPCWTVRDMTGLPPGKDHSFFKFQMLNAGQDNKI